MEATKVLHPHILDLPVEILQHIADFCDVQDLPQLRLVCSDLNAAIFDTFAYHFLENVCCFVLNPGRLRRLHEITSRQHLVRRIKVAKFCLDPYESANAAEWRLGELSGLDDDYVRSQYNKFSRPPDHRLLSEVFQNLSKAGCRDIHIELNCYCSQNDHEDGYTQVEEGQQRNVITSSILRAAMSANVRSYTACNNGCSSDIFIEALSSWSHALESVSIDDVTCFPWNDGESDEDTWPLILRALNSCPLLEHFYIDDSLVTTEDDGFRHLDFSGPGSVGREIVSQSKDERT